jgi:hypothetical protein
MTNDHPRSEVSYYLWRARQLGGLDPTQHDPARWDFQGALEQISSAYRFARADETALIDATSQQIKQKRTQHVQELVGVVEAVLGLPLDKVTPKDVERGRTALAELRRVHPDPGEVTQLEQRWQTFERKMSVRVALHETRAQLKMLWETPFLHLAKYDEALELARRKAREYPDEPEFQQLAQEAEDRRGAAYQKEATLTKLAVLGRFKDLIEEVQRLYDNGERELPWYEWSLLTIDGQQIKGAVFAKTVPWSQDPIRHLATMAGEYEDGKADEYLQRAQAALPVDPESADYWIRLPSEGDMGRGIEKFEYWSLAKYEELENFRQRQIVPLLEKRQRARTLLSEAIERDQDPERAWGLVDAAAREDPYLTEELEQARGWLRPHLRARWEQELRRAEDQRAARVQLEQVLSTAARIQDHAACDPELAEVQGEAQALLVRCTDDLETEKLADTAVRQIGLLFENPAAADAALRAIESQIGAHLNRFPVLKGLRQYVNQRLKPSDAAPAQTAAAVGHEAKEA